MAFFYRFHFTPTGNLGSPQDVNGDGWVLLVAAGSGDRGLMGWADRMVLARDAANESPPRDGLRPGLRPEGVLDPDTLADVDRAQAEAESAAPGCLADETAWENALDVEDLRELADRAHRGEHICLRKT